MRGGGFFFDKGEFALNLKQNTGGLPADVSICCRHHLVRMIAMIGDMCKETP